MTRRATAGSIAAVLVVAGLTAAAVALSDARDGPSRSASADGPMRPASAHGMVIRDQAGTRFTDGFEILQLQGEEPATVRSVKSVGGSANFRFLGAMIAGPDRKLAAINYMIGYPPDEPQLAELQPAENAVLLPIKETRANIGYELLLGYEIVEDSAVGYRTGVEIIYEVGGRTYVWQSPAELLYCPVGLTSRKCRAEAVTNGLTE